MLSLVATFAFAAMLSTPLPAQDPSNSNPPVPPKSDVPYLLHASNLIETEADEAHQESKKNDTLFWVEGESSGARTPLPEPVFIIKTNKLNANKIEMYKFDVKGGRRELLLKERPKDSDAHPLHITVKKMDNGVYRIEADEILQPGEYSLSPSGSNEVFSFQVF